MASNPQQPLQFERRGDGLLVRAPAKINLSLLIAGKRSDGFHELETIMAKIDLCDEILVENRDQDGIELICRGAHWAPDGPENLVYRAAQMAFDLAGRPAGVRLTLTKNIPAGSGLGGASSDAAATLMGLNQHFALGLSQTQLAQIAATLGSDIAFFLYGPLAFCSGRGEKIAEISAPFAFEALLLLPEVHVSTKQVYANYRHDPKRYEQLSQQIESHLAHNRIDLVAKMCANMLQESCFDLFGQLGDLKMKAEGLGLGSVCLSGSGAALFSVLSEESPEVETLRDRIATESGCQCLIVSNSLW